MREEEVHLTPKIVFITVSIIAYYVSLFFTGRYAKMRCRINTPFVLKLTAITAAFAVLMGLFRSNMRVNILVTVLYVWSTVLELYRAKKALDLIEE